MLDHVAAIRKAHAAAPVSTATMIPDAMAAMARPVMAPHSDVWHTAGGVWRLSSALAKCLSNDATASFLLDALCKEAAGVCCALRGRSVRSTTRSALRSIMQSPLFDNSSGKRIVSAMFVRVNSRCAHQLRPPEGAAGRGCSLR